MTFPAADPGNRLNGPVNGPAVQARDIRGGVHISAGPGPGLPRPRQLPPEPGNFVDRAEPASVLASLAAETAGQGSCRLAVIWGPGGTGKTALALRCLHGAADLFPGGLLYAGLGAFGPGGPADPDVVRGRWLRALGEQAPADPEEAAALWRSLTADRAVAVLADDAASAGQVRALLPGKGLVVVTSRRELPGLVAGDGARLVRLGPLASPAAAELAGRIAGRPRAEPGELEDLTRLCGGLPLAVCTAAARLAARPHLPIAHVTAELAASLSRHLLDDQEGRIRAVMDTSYAALTPRAARAYRICALHPGPDFTAPAAAALLDAGTAEAEELIGVLAGASLLTETAPHRWAFHDITRAHARHEAGTAESADDRAAAVGRLTEWYLQTAAEADLLVLPGRLRIAPAFALPRQRREPAYPGPDEALERLDAELPGMMAVQQLAIEHGFNTLALQFPDVLWGVFSRHQNFPAWRVVCERAVRAARICGDARAAAWAGVRLANCHLSAGDSSAAAAIADEAIRTARRAGDRAGEASAQEQRGNAALAAGAWDEAIRCYCRGLDCWERITEHQRAQAIMHRQLGRAYSGAGDALRAEEHLGTGRRMFRDLGETYHEARTVYVLAGIRLDTGQTAEAAALLQEARPLMEQAGHKLSLSELLTRLARAHDAAGDAAQARACLDRATELQENLGLAGDHPARAETERTARHVGQRP